MKRERSRTNGWWSRRASGTQRRGRPLTPNWLSVLFLCGLHHTVSALRVPISVRVIFLQMYIYPQTVLSFTLQGTPRKSACLE